MIRCFLALLAALQATCAIDFSALEQVAVQEGGRKNLSWCSPRKRFSGFPERQP